MKKRISILLILVVAFMTINVHAEGEAWPKDYSHGDFTFSVEGVYLNLYELNAQDEMIEVTTEGDSTIKATQSAIDYMQHNPKKSVDLIADDFTFEPTYTTGKLGNIDTLFVKTNFSIVKEDFEDIFLDYMDMVDENISYIIDVCLKYKITNYPSNYNHFYQQDITRGLLSMFSPNANTFKINPTESNYYVMDKVIIAYNSETDEVEINFTNTLTEENAYFKTTILGLTANEKTNSNDEDEYRVLIHNFDNTEVLVNLLEKQPEPTEDDIPDNPITSTDANQTVAIPDTGKTVPFLLYGISIILILAGAVMIIKIMKQPKKEV